MGLEFDAFFWYVLMMLENMLFYLGWIVEIIFVLLWMMLERWMEGMIWWKLVICWGLCWMIWAWILIWVAPTWRRMVTVTVRVDTCPSWPSDEVVYRSNLNPNLRRLPTPHNYIITWIIPKFIIFTSSILLEFEFDWYSQNLRLRG